jgi:2-hydroxy-3-keto-5-methylthiopentenyl-1-phosphate phosphatase
MFRTKKVAAIFDFDKTLSLEYMQAVVFRRYDIDEDKFWEECQEWSDENVRILGSNHPELSYMNMFLRYVEDGRMPGLNNKKMKELGDSIRLYPGVEYLLNTLFCMGAEIYIVSSGIRALLGGLQDRIRFTTKNPNFKIEKIYGGDFRERDGLIHDIASVVSPSDKLRAIYEISKGCDFYGFDFTVSLPKENGRSVPLERMCYIGDGQSDVPCFNLIKDSGGFTLGVFDPKDPRQFEQIEQIRQGGRLSTIAIADYSPGSTAEAVLVGKIKEFLYKVSENYEFRQTLSELKGNKPVPIHPWTAQPEFSE